MSVRSRSALTRRALLAALAIGWVAPALADDRDHDDDDERREIAEAVARGDILPLHEIKRRVWHLLPGELVGIEAERDEQGRWVYEFRAIAADGRRIDIYVDAASAAILRKETP